MININYQKRKNAELFKSLENQEGLFLSNTQNYIPIYKRFFSLNETNYNNINLNNKWYISSVGDCSINGENVFNCRIKNINNNKTKDKEAFFKLAPLIDPYKFLIGKYNENEKIYLLPDVNSNENSTMDNFIDPNNSAYVDAFFAFLSSNLIHNYNFINGVDYYGSFLAIKNNFKLNVFDDIDYLNNSDFFVKNKNILFTVDDYSHLFSEEETKLKPITIQHNISSKSNISIKSLNADIFEDIFEETNEEVKNSEDTLLSLIDITELHELQKDSYENNDENKNNENKNVTLKSNSTCSSRSSHTTEEYEEGNDEDDGDENCDNCPKGEDNDELDENEDDEDDNSFDDESEFEEEQIYATIPKFPVQVICMENCENTFDNLILTTDLSTDEWFSAFMQIIMILITYQKAFNFTHNDLHTNNIMYIHTEKKYLYYCYKQKYYKVPTFGRIFKIIDFGRSIYKFNGNVFCSDSFKMGGDAATQYNTEPYFNEKKPRLEPNYSFDLCRLACSIFDYVVEDFEEIQNLDKCKDPVKKLIVEWCLDDKGVNMLYKNNGTDRYPEFKLYKMIARLVHNHKPHAQLQRPEFKKYSNFKGEIPNDVINIDNIPVQI
jgi:hypothetical protein